MVNMIKCSRKILENGLTSLVHEDTSSPMVAINILYKVGSKDESPQRTGLTHLFEHLMFSGSKHAKDYDMHIQLAGGENNAFTNSDITNFYILLPKENIEVGLWLEADRMSNLKLTKKALETQKKVVIEEFKETCLNEPYGDAWHHISDLSYEDHHYKWPTIGKDMQHIAEVTLDEAIEFYTRFYTPQNAIICLSGNISNDEGHNLIEKWFGHIKGEHANKTIIKYDNSVKGFQSKIIHADVPSPALYLAFKMSDRLDYDFYLTDILSDLLSSGRSSRFYQSLIKEQQLFTFLDAYISGTTDPGLLVIDGRLADGVSIEKARSAVWEELDHLTNHIISDRELDKIKNKAEANLQFSELGILNKSMSLCYFEYLGDVELINNEVATYNKIKAVELKNNAVKIFDRSNHVEIIYQPSGSAS
jgi:predicted Zn-dependent peptidase